MAERPPYAFGYSRISKQKPGFADARDTYSMQAQREECYQYWESCPLLKAAGVMWGEVSGDEVAVSGKTPLLMRKAGGALNVLLEAGDHVIMPKLDRAWRDTRDMHITINEWNDRGITVHFASERMVLTPNDESVMGAVSKMLVSLMGYIAEMERKRIVERITQGLRAKKKRLGYVRVIRPDVKICAFIRWLVEVRGFGTTQATKVLSAYKVKNRVGQISCTESRSVKSYYKQALEHNIPPSGKTAALNMRLLHNIEIYINDYNRPRILRNKGTKHGKKCHFIGPYFQADPRKDPQEYYDNYDYSIDGIRLREVREEVPESTVDADSPGADAQGTAEAEGDGQA